MIEFALWAIVIRPPITHEEIISIPGVEHDPNRGIPIFNGTLGEFQQYYKKPFTVYTDGHYIVVEAGQ